MINYFLDFPQEPSIATYSASELRSFHLYLPLQCKMNRPIGYFSTTSKYSSADMAYWHTYIRGARFPMGSAAIVPCTKLRMSRECLWTSQIRNWIQQAFVTPNVPSVAQSSSVSQYLQSWNAVCAPARYYFLLVPSLFRPSCQRVFVRRLYCLSLMHYLNKPWIACAILRITVVQCNVSFLQTC